MEASQEKKQTTRIGYIAADATTKTFDSGKTVANVTILSGSDENKKATYIRGWNAMADRLKNIKTGEKWEFKGEVSIDKKDDKEYEVMNAKEAYPHIKKEVKGEVKHISEKSIGQTEMKNIMVVSSEMEGGREVSNVYNIELYGEKNIAKGKDINVGDMLATKGHVRMYDYVKDGENKINRSFQNPYEIQNLSTGHDQEKAIDNKASKTQKAAASKESKAKGKGISM